MMKIQTDAECTKFNFWAGGDVGKPQRRGRPDFFPAWGRELIASWEVELTCKSVIKQLRIVSASVIDKCTLPEAEQNTLISTPEN